MRMVKVRLSQGDLLAETMKEIRVWLDSHKIQPAKFGTALDTNGYALTLAFRHEDEADRFRQQFRDAGA